MKPLHAPPKNQDDHTFIATVAGVDVYIDSDYMFASLGGYDWQYLYLDGTFDDLSKKLTEDQHTQLREFFAAYENITT